MRRVVAVVGYLLVALIVLGLCLEVFAALRSHQPFYGLNYLGLPLSAYSTLLALAIAGAVGLVWLWQRARRGRGKKRPAGPA